MNESKTIWLIGLSASGKTTLSHLIGNEFKKLNKTCVILDGDVLRDTLNDQLGFNREDRKENIRRIASVAKILNDQGINVVVAAISPYEEDRKLAKKIIGNNRFYGFYLNPGINICIQRDPKGLYKKAQQGEVLNFTGINDPFESATDFLEIDTGKMPAEECIKYILNHI